MGLFQRVWSKDTSSESKMYPDSVYMYDAGDFVGMLTIKGNSKRWSGFTVVSRVKTSETIEETLEPADEFTVPMKFFSVEQYPTKIEGSILWIPGWKIQWSQPPRATEVQQDLQLPQPSHQLPLKQRRNQEQTLPSPPLVPLYQSPSSQPLPKSPSGKQGQSQQSLQNKSNSASKPKASLSSNQAFHEMPKQLTRGKSGELPSLSSPSDHISPLLQPLPISQPSPCPPPPSRPGGLNRQPTSSSRDPSSSRRHLPSQQAPRRHGGKSQHPSSSQLSSHE